MTNDSKTTLKDVLVIFDAKTEKGFKISKSWKDLEKAIHDLQEIQKRSAQSGK